jgi:hypothetical protein
MQDIKNVLKLAKSTKPVKKKEDDKDKQDEAPTKRSAVSFIKSITKSGK